MISVVISYTSFTINILEQNLTAKSTQPQNEMIITLVSVCSQCYVALLSVELLTCGMPIITAVSQCLLRLRSRNSTKEG